MTTCRSRYHIPSVIAILFVILGAIRLVPAAMNAAIPRPGMHQYDIRPPSTGRATPLI
jgi:hypothetical protein